MSASPASSVITSRRNSLVARFRAAANGDAGAMLLDGTHLVGDALRAGMAIEHAAVTAAARGRPEVRDLAAALSAARVPMTDVSPNVMDALSPVRSATGIVAIAARPSNTLERTFSSAPQLVLIVVDVQDPGNVGAIARAAEAAGATGFVAAGASADPFGWKALRGSMGSLLRLPTATSTPEEAVTAARRRGCRVLATVPRGGRSIYDADYTTPLAVLIGGEGAGLAGSLVDEADDRVSIPMEAPVESLNVAVASALIVYEARRQRSRSGSRSGV